MPLPTSPGLHCHGLESTELPETPALKEKTLKKRETKAGKLFFTGTQLSGSEKGKKVGSALHSWGTARITAEG